MRLTHALTASTLAYIGLGAAVAVITIAAPAARAATADAAIPPVMECAALAKADLSRLDTQITSSAKATRDGHDYCDVKGYISPMTQFEALLPLGTWRGDYLQQGCGGFCGHVDVDLQDPSRTSGYQAPFAPLANGEMVVAADDEGHETPSNGEALWGKTDPELRLVFGYTSEHQLAQVVRTLVRSFYGREPSYSYFSGVSDGGHEALVLAQRYPEDFNGIIAGAPANNWAPLGGLFEPWVAAMNRNAEGKQVLTAEKLPALHAAVMAACADAHGVIQDPRACAFDPASIRCTDGADRPNCLTDEQVNTVREEYRGPHDAQGRNLFDGGEPYGSELAWQFWLVMPAADAAAPGDTYSAALGVNYLNDLAFWTNPATDYTLGSIPFTAEMHQRLQELGGIYDATSPDLAAFHAHGGKIIIYHSWADQAIPPFATIDYYRAVANQMGGYPAIQSFSRLYMIPGLYHCPCGQKVDGDPATSVQFMPQLADWVEHGQAPGEIVLPVTAQSTGEHLSELHIAPFDPLRPAPKNNGLNSNYDYIGASTDYQKRNELWCTWDGPSLKCSPRN
jgi:hypothetical protein